MFKLIKILNSKLAWKMLAIYISVIFIPSLLIGIKYYYETKEYILEVERDLVQRTLDQYCSDIDANLVNMENMYEQLQRTTNFMRFLLGEYPSKSSQVSAYVSEFDNMFIYCFSSSKFIEDITVYMTNDSLLEMGAYLRQSNPEYQSSLEPEISTGYWQYDFEHKQVIYRRSIKSYNSKTVLGFLELKCNEAIIQEALSKLAGDYRSITLIYNNNSYDLGEQKSEPYETTIDIYGKMLRIPITIRLRADASQVNNSMVDSLLMTILLFILLSLILFFILYQLSWRITKFSQSLANNLDNYPELYDDKKHDELSMLIRNYNNMIKHNNYLLNQVKIEKLHQQEIEYKALQAQINPHFIYNSLEGIRMMAELRDELNISNAIFSLGQLMKYAFSISEKEVPITQELEYIRQYCNLQNMRLGDRIELHISCNNIEEIKCPRFTLQPMVENSVKYGFGKNISYIRIWINATFHDNVFHIRIMNSGQEIPEEKLTEMNRLLKIGGSLKAYSSGNGISLENVNTRMKYLHPQTFSMKLMNTEQGVSVDLFWEPKDCAEIMKGELL